MEPNVYKEIEKLVATFDKVPADMKTIEAGTMHKNNEGKLGKNNAIEVRPADIKLARESDAFPWDDVSWVYRDPWGRLKISPQLLVKYLLSKENENRIIPVRKAGGTTSIFVYQNGCYKEMYKDELKGFVKSYMPLEYRTSKDIDAVYNELITEPCSVTLDDLDSNEDIINFENGLLHLSTHELTEHTPDVLSTIRIPCRYRPELTLDDAPIFSKFLDTLTSGDNIDATFILQFIGAILSNVPGYRYKKLLVLYGPGNTGKSQLRQLVTWLVGAQNCHSIDLSNIGRRFGTGQLYGKRLVGSGDMSFAKISEIATLKELTGGDDLNAEFKGKDAFTFRYKGFLWFNCNELPHFAGDRGQHVYDRFCIVCCGNVIPPEIQDHGLLEKMKGEAEAIVSASIHNFMDTVKAGYKFTESETMACIRDQYAEQNNSVVTFVKECCTREGRTKRSNFVRFYKAWCQENGLYAESSRDIGKTLSDVFKITPMKSSEFYYPLTVKMELIPDIWPLRGR